MTDKHELEEGDRFLPQFDANGLIPCITIDAKTGDVLMMAYMNQDALLKTLETGEAHYWSRSRKALWHKGGTSGFVQVVKGLRTDCDQDCLLLSVDVKKPAGGQSEEGTCHTGRESCFYRIIELPVTDLEKAVLIFTDDD
ncbi:MAG: phosphoribosyl-AMP cyclohydrolase [Rhodospirillales bacterium]|nr:phosphoribosyl-AMP cyclohydrolase [Alphaproteobacteria bacterium]MCB1840263.1 phosphoribosyl-AMP cyclohydrolase [Alphaproteobacteria bacterium]MCB9975990.1 phosphoribosyl-AMP cyclohydrolase [Rhodospirillales bacterium]